MPQDLEKLVATTDRDGNSVLVPESAVKRKEEFDALRRPGDPKTNTLDLLMQDPAEEIVNRETITRGSFDPDEYRTREAVQSFRDVAENFSDVSGTTRTPFSDVQRGVSQQLVEQHPSQSDILSEADLQMQDLRRKRALGLL